MLRPSNTQHCSRAPRTAILSTPTILAISQHGDIASSSAEQQARLCIIVGSNRARRTGSSQMRSQDRSRFEPRPDLDRISSIRIAPRSHLDRIRINEAPEPKNGSDRDRSGFEVRSAHRTLHNPVACLVDFCCRRARAPRSRSEQKMYACWARPPRV